MNEDTGLRTSSFPSSTRIMAMVVVATTLVRLATS